MRVLISAYACEPDRGSEPEVGLQTVLAAASSHEVWVITRANNLPPLRAFLDDHPLRDRIHLLGFDVEGLALRVKRRAGLVGLHWYHDLWQRRVAGVAARLDQEVGFDLVHHATFAAYWTRTGIARVGKPFVWGPVGGGVAPPSGLLPVMGLRGALGDLARVLVRFVVARLYGARRTAKRASVVLVQNPATARRLRILGRAVVLPNALIAGQLSPRGGGSASRETPHIVTAGRLVGWKGTALAIASLRHVPNSTVVLDVYGSGPEQKRLLRLSRRLGLESRVRFLGAVPREDLLSAVEGASALVHPALHEEAGFVVAEALALGTPVVGLDHGGPPVVASFFPNVPSRMVEPSTPAETARRIGEAVGDLIGRRGVSPTEHHAPYTRALLEAYEAAVASQPE